MKFKAFSASSWHVNLPNGQGNAIELRVYSDASTVKNGTMAGGVWIMEWTESGPYTSAHKLKNWEWM